MPTANRRQFLRGTLGLGVPTAFGAAVWNAVVRADERGVPASGRSAAIAELVPAKRGASAFGTKVAVTALHREKDRAEAGAAAALAELKRVEQLMSLYRPDSQLCRLNRERALEDPAPELIEILRTATALSQRTGGTFDVTVQPLWELYSEAHAAGTSPSASAIEKALRRVDWRRLDVSPNRIRLGDRGTAVTLNGIAQGFAADRAIAALRRHGIEHALIDAGEIGTVGGKSVDAPWVVGIQHPRREDAYASLARLRGRCLATSGDYATRFGGDYRDHHLFDPRTGRSPGELASVSVAAPTATQADALSTAVFVLGAARGLQLLKSLPNVDALLITKEGRTLATGGFPRQTAWPFPRPTPEHGDVETT